MAGLIIGIVVVLLVLIIIVSSIKIVNTGYLCVVERFGQFNRVLEPGWHVIIPFADFVRKKVSTKQQIIDVPPQTVITKDNVNISVDNVIFYKLLNAQDAVYNIEDFRSGIMQIRLIILSNEPSSFNSDNFSNKTDNIDDPDPPPREDIK